MKDLILILLIGTTLSAYSQNMTREEALTKDALEAFRKCTVSLGIVDTAIYQTYNEKFIKEKNFNIVGTGVMFPFKFGKINGACIVTAKHVFHDPKNNFFPRQLNFRLSMYDSLGVNEYFGEQLNLYMSNAQMWIAHPDSTIDLACIVLVHKPREYFPPVSIISYESFAKNDDYFEGKEIYVFGYPGFISPDLSNQAFLRKGIIGWVSKNKRYLKDRIMIDCNIYPGNSGGPVFSVPKTSSTTDFVPPRFYGLVSQTRTIYNKVQTQNVQLVDSLKMPFYTPEPTASGIIITADKVYELLQYISKDYINIINKQIKR